MPGGAYMPRGCTCLGGMHTRVCVHGWEGGGGGCHVWDTHTPVDRILDTR